MLKAIYFTTLFILSFLLFVFSKQEDAEINCTEGRGKIVRADSIGHRLMIVMDDDRKLAPQSLGSDVVLMPHQQISVCYTIDSSRLIATDEPVPVNIARVVYIK